MPKPARTPGFNYTPGLRSMLCCQARGTKRQREEDQAHPASPFMKHVDFMLHVLAGAERRK